MTIPTTVAKPEYRGTASGNVREAAVISGDLPVSLAVFGHCQANATLFVAIFPLIGLLAAIFILPEVYGYEHD